MEPPNEKPNTKLDDSIKTSMMAYLTQELSMPTSRRVYDFATSELMTDKYLLMAAVTAAIEKPTYSKKEVKKLRTFSELMFSSDDEFDNTFKLNRSTVRKIITNLKKMSLFETTEDTSIIKSLCSLLYFLSNKEATFEDLCCVFGCKDKTVFVEDLLKVSKALADVGDSVNLRWPIESECLETCERFIRKFKFPDVMGVLGNCIFGDIKSGVLFQAVVDDRTMFLDVNATEMISGNPDPIEYFKSSPTYSLVKEFAAPECNVLAASTYPEGIPNLVTPFIDDGHLGAPENSFNAMISDCLGILKKTLECQILRFPRLESVNLPPSDAKHVILASAVLHNASILFHDLAPY